jgi:hypothetical protein
MSKAKKNTAQEEHVHTPVQHVRNDWKTLVDKVSYKAIVNNIPYLAFVSLLLIIYINNSQRAIEIQGELNRQNKILKELRWKYMDVKSRLMNTQMETQVIKSASKIGLKPMTLPAYSVKVEADSVKTAMK